MDYEAQLKLQAYLDGELPEKEAQEVANWLARDQEAAGLLTELRQTHKALGGFEEGIRLPESREFFWSKLEREIERLEPAAPRRTAPVRLLAQLRRLLVPMAGLALLVIAGLMVFPAGQSPEPMEATFADSGGMIHRDDMAKATFVSLAYPADDESADDEMGQPD
jgi:anti-sigma factor RsiW